MTKTSLIYLGKRLGLFGLLLLPILEIAVRLWLPQQLTTTHDIYIADFSGLGMRIVPNLDRTINTGEKDVRLVTDAQGYRVAYPGQGRGTVNILALGDSFLQALQVDYEDTTTGLLEAQLSAALHQPVRVVNTGTGAYSPNQYAILAEQELAAQPYDLVLVFIYAANDLVDAPVAAYEPITPNYRPFRFPRYFTWGEIVDAFLYPINDGLEKHAHLYVLLKNQFSAFLAKIGLSARYFPETLLVRSATKANWGVTADVLAQIEVTAAQHDLPVIYILLPSSYQVVPEELAWAQEAFGITASDVDVQQPTRRLFSEMQQRQLNVFDMYPPLVDFYVQNHTAPFGKVDSHLNEAGHEVVAARLLEPILDALTAP